MVWWLRQEVMSLIPITRLEMVNLFVVKWELMFERAKINDKAANNGPFKRQDILPNEF